MDGQISKFIAEGAVISPKISEDHDKFVADAFEKEDKNLDGYINIWEFGGNQRIEL